MNIHQHHTLTPQIDTSLILRRSSALTRLTFFAAILVADVATIVTMSYLTGTTYHLFAYGYRGSIVSYLQIGLLCAVIFAFTNLLRRNYRIANFFAFKPHVSRTLHLWNMTFIALLALGFLAQISAIYSRIWIVLFYGTTALMLLAVRYVVVRLTQHGAETGAISAQRIYIVGSGQHIEEFVTRFQPRKFGVDIVGCHFLTPVGIASPQLRQEILNRDIEQAVNNARQLEPDAIFLAMPWSATEAIDRSAESFSTLPIEIHLGGEHVLDRFAHVELSKFGPMTSLQLTRVPLTRFERLIKRTFDIITASVALVLLSPLLLAIALLIKRDSAGPVFFLQHRYGFNQKPFRIVKFRTMEALDDGPIVIQAKQGDPRITRVGRWLRRWNLDEVPQLLNVIRGDMSLVGPRPHALAHNREYEQRISLYARRHNVKPGITGWAQIHGFRGETDTDDKMRKRVEHDLYYIDNWSITLDLQIMIRTVVSPTSYRNAY
jgi:Undecaprenyl-phosphate glucose phosphotransferase